MKQEAHGSLRSYIIGFGLSIVLTLVAYILVANEMLSGRGLVAVIIGLALIQLFVQLFFFLHLGKEGRPRWNLTSLLFAALVVVIVVIGSLWIMYNLDYHSMDSDEVDKAVMEEEGIYR